MYTGSWFSLLNFMIYSVVLTIVAIPEGFAMSITLCLAFLIKNMLRDNLLVRKMAACERLAYVNIICAEKSGVITQGRMSLV